MKTTQNRIIKVRAHKRLRAGSIGLSLLASLLATGCAIAPSTAVQETVGPRVAAAAPTRPGVLQVYSRSIWTTADDLETSLLSYSDYDIQAADGTLLKRVINGDEVPERVELPDGRYTIVAQSDISGTVSVPVAIEAGRTTVVRLDQEAEKAFAGIAAADLVRLPEGRAIGFRAKGAAPRRNPVIMAADSKIGASALMQPKS
jgi:hypothetical protein